MTGRWGRRERASSRCQQETCPEGDAGAAWVSKHQMDHRPFQVPSAGYRIQLREWPQGSEMVRNHETLELPAGCCQHRHTASHQVSSSVFFWQATSCPPSLYPEKNQTNSAPTLTHTRSVFSCFFYWSRLTIQYSEMTLSMYLPVPVFEDAVAPYWCWQLHGVINGLQGGVLFLTSHSFSKLYLPPHEDLNMG